MTTTIRPYRETDRADVYDVCVRTGDGGADASGLYSVDDLLPDIYAGPYVEHEPDLAFVVDNGERVIGYAIGTGDTRAFARWYSEEWWPSVAAKYEASDAQSEAERALVRNGSQAERMLVAEVDEYPAHLHIDLLPETQGQGLGRTLIDTLRAELRRRGIPGLHLVAGRSNTNACAFYARLGFAELPSSNEGAVTFGIRP